MGNYVSSVSKGNNGSGTGTGTGAGSGFSASNEYARRQINLLNIAKALRDKGASHDLDVPTIAVIGKQSSGKSSLFEAISGVRVPRDSGTCTRCPLECNLTASSGPWTCSISLRLSYDPTHPNRKPGKNDLVPFVSHLTDPAAAERMLRRAQAAVLAWPRTRPQEFLVMSDEEVERAFKHSANGSGSGGRAGRHVEAFSRNTIVVDVRCSGAANISFADLPGLISYMPEMPEAVDMVEEIVTGYIKTNCIIIVTVPMSDDIENQKALQMARVQDPKGERTVVVLTKPDDFGGSIESRLTWLRAVNGELHPLKLGYYCVKLANDTERLAARSIKGSHQHRPELEKNYFAGVHPLQGLNNPRRLGVQNLVTDLSMHLTSMLDLALPSLKRTAQHSILATQRKLADFEPTDLSSTPHATIVKHITALSGVLREYVDDSEGRQDLIQQNDALFETFMLEIERTAPEFVPYDRDASGEGNVGATSSALVLNKENEGPSLGGCGVMDVYDVRREMKSQSGRGLPDAVSIKSIRRLVEIMTRSWQPLVEVCLTKAASQLKFYLRNEIESEFNHVPWLKANVMELAFAHFEDVFKKARLSVLATLELERNGTFTRNKTFYNDARERWYQTYTSEQGFSSESRTVVSEGGDGTLEYKPPAEPYGGTIEPNDLDEPTDGKWPDSTGTHAIAAPEEQTLNDDNVQQYVSVQKRLTRAIYEGKPASNSATSLPSRYGEKTGRDRALDELSSRGYGKLPRDHLKHLFPSSDFTEEIKLMARMRAYFGVMQMRVIDNIPSAIDIYLNRAFVNTIQDALVTGILDRSSTSADDLAGLLAEKPDVTKERVELENTLERLKNIQTELQGLSQ